jgi:hypothetical protein
MTCDLSKRISKALDKKIKSLVSVEKGLKGAG